ncbi:MAG TPA: SDR family oxidoreductase [Bryobacteraceae bacterium]|nr:SDR family oxidoreductase [Bryobacteraceae bacterium]
MGRLQGKSAVVTGASRGIGQAIARAFAREGADVMICSRKQEAIAASASEMQGLPGRVVPFACHVGKPEDLERLVRGAEAEFGKIDILVNNAATNIAQGPCLTFDDGQFDKMVEVNLKSTYRLVKLVAPGMAARGGGSIINIASIAGLKPQLHGLLYSMTKAALIMMTQCYAVELGGQGVRVNAIAPGLIQTVLSEYYWKDEARKANALGAQPVRHLGQPDEIAGVAVMLAGDEGSYVTGQTIVVDGGKLLGSGW